MSSNRSLWGQVKATTQSALACGALKPIATQVCTVDEAGLSFKVRVIDSIARKEAARKSRSQQSTDKPDNPFLPYEEDLFVDDLSDTHVCLLNKFNVVDHHVLIVTRHYESQNTWLTHADFAALAHCLGDMDGLGFYNGGTEAGASQHHKHLQLVPFAAHEAVTDLPINAVIKCRETPRQQEFLLSALPFDHRVQVWPPARETFEPAAAAARWLETYREMMTQLGLDLTAPQPDQPYNLLITRKWMLGVRRSRASYADIGVNSLGYAGWLLVKNEADLERLVQIGPMTLLRQVGYPLPDRPLD